jgi:signal transduction histidine kinase
MLMVGPPGREIATPPGDAITAETIRKFAASPKPEPVTFYVHKDGEVLLRTISPSIASQQACVDCHNRIRPQQQQWRLNEVMGAFVAEVRADPVLRRAKLESIAIAVAVFLASSGIGFYISVLQHRQLVRRAEQHRAEAASRAKSSFLANVGHDLRAPLNAIIGFSEIMGGEALGPIGNAKYRDCVDDILRCGQHLQAIIDDILDMSKIQAEALILREDTVDIPATIGACLDLMRPRARDGRVELVNRVPPVLPGFHADAQRVKQIVMNLLSNAVKFTPPAGRVSVDASIQDGALRLTISDTGIGMSAAEVAIALRPFAKIDNALRRKYEGTGLGLPLVAALVQQHGGALKIDSTPGAGTTIRVVFPPERTLAG